MYFEFGVNIFTVFLFMLVSHEGNCLKCYSCNSRNDESCHDPFIRINNESVFRVIDCEEELSTRNIINYISNLMNLLGVPTTVNDNDKYTNRLRDGNEQFACQKIEFDDFGNHVTIRECVLLSDTVCDRLGNGTTDLSVFYCDVCNTDYCNNSFNVIVEYRFISAIILTNIVMLYYNII